MKRVHVWNRQFVVGACRLPKHPPVGIKLKSFLKDPFPQSPATCDYTAPALPVIQNVEGNDQYGDCVFAEDAHYLAVVTGTGAGKLYSYTEPQTLADYSAVTGFNPSDPATDQGADPTVDLNYRTQNGYADGSKDAGWALVDATNQAEVQYAINTFGNLKMWFGIPDSIASSLSGLQNGFVWDVSAGSPDPNNGHCIGAGGYNPAQILGAAPNGQGVLVYTWGFLGLVTWAALAAWFSPGAGGGLAVRVTADWVSQASGKSPTGLDLPGLLSAFGTYFGGSLPSPAPSPPAPPPAPAPTAPPSLADAVAAVDAAFDGQLPLVTRDTAKAVAQGALSPLWPSS